MTLYHITMTIVHGESERSRTMNIDILSFNLGVIFALVLMILLMGIIKRL